MKPTGNLTRLILVSAMSVALFAQTRFDIAVRNDLLAGLSGNSQALDRGMAACEKILAENPKDVDALVWHGIGTLILSRLELQKGNGQGAMEQAQKGIAEMDRAVEMEPGNLGVRISRGAALREATHEMPPFMSDPLLEKARGDFQYTFDLQKDNLPPAEHPLGELLQALGDIYSRQGKQDDAAKYYGLLKDRLPATEYGKRAAEWLKTRQPLPAERSGCVGCHAK